jgi:tryptophan-rich sensory protein
MRRTGLRVPGALLEYRGPDRWIERGIEFMNHRLSLILFTVLVVGGGLGIGFLTAPGDWYAQLKKPPFTPPGWIFGPTWTVLYVLIGGTGWWLWQRAHGEWLMKLWWTQLALNFMWSPVFFGLREIGRGLAVILLLLVVILVFIATAWQRHHAAAWLFVPYAAWVAFASVLNGWIFAFN